MTKEEKIQDFLNNKEKYFYEWRMEAIKSMQDQIENGENIIVDIFEALIKGQMWRDTAEKWLLDHEVLAKPLPNNNLLIDDETIDTKLH